MLHIHIYRESRDCDGRTDRSYTHELEDGQDFYAQYATELGWAAAGWCGERGEVTINTRVVDVKEYDGFAYSSEVSFATEEGYVNTTIEMCDCLDTGTTYRDHTAESMGY